MIDYGDTEMFNGHVMSLEDATDKETYRARIAISRRVKSFLIQQRCNAEALAESSIYRQLLSSEVANANKANQALIISYNKWVKEMQLKYPPTQDYLDELEN